MQKKKFFSSEQLKLIIIQLKKYFSVSEWF